MATPTLANSFKHRSLAGTVWSFAQPNSLKTQSTFLVFPTGNAERPWRIAVSAANRTVSLHKSLIRAIKKCTRLNEQHDTPLEPLKVALSGFPDVNSYRAYYEGVGE